MVRIHSGALFKNLKNTVFMLEYLGMRFSPEGFNCGADVATWATGIIDPEKGPMALEGETDFKALVSCEGCPLDNVEFPNDAVPRVSNLQLQAFFERNCPNSPDFESSSGGSPKQSCK